MSDDGLRELTERLVAMAPEPNPLPQEVVVAPAPSPRRWSPVLVSAAAAAVVLAVVGIPLLFVLGGEPAATTQAPSSTLPQETTVPPETTLPPATTLPPTTVTTTATTVPEGPPLVDRDTVVYLVQAPVNSFTGNPALVPFLTTVEAPPEDIDPDRSEVTLDSLRLLTRPDLVLPDGFQNHIPAGVAVQGVTVTEIDGDRVYVIDMNDRFLEGNAGLLGDITMLNQLVYTATRFDVERVLFTVNGRPIEAYGSEGMVLTDPVGRDDFLDELNSIVITEPLIEGGDDVPIVRGIANVYEATVSLEIVAGTNGEVLYRDFTTATCGTGCWGDFEFLLDTPAIGPGTLVRVFWDSPEDGQPSDVVTVPVGGVWQLVP